MGNHQPVLPAAAAQRAYITTPGSPPLTVRRHFTIKSSFIYFGQVRDRDAGVAGNTYPQTCPRFLESSICLIFH